MTISDGFFRIGDHIEPHWNFSYFLGFPIQSNYNVRKYLRYPVGLTFDRLPGTLRWTLLERKKKSMWCLPLNVDLDHNNHKKWNETPDWPVASSRGDSLPWAQAVKAASTTKGTTSRISHAGNLGLKGSSLPGPDELLLPEVTEDNDWLPLLIFLNIMLRSPSTIWWTGVPWTRPERVEAIHAWCCRYQTFSFGNESKNMGCSDDELATPENLVLFRLWIVPEDTRWEFRTNRRYSGVSWDPTGGTSPTPCSRGGWLNLHSFRRRVNAFEKIAWALISSPVVSVHETLGTHDPKTSQIGINEPARWGTWKAW